MIEVEETPKDVSLYVSPETGVVKFGILLWQKAQKDGEQTIPVPLSVEQVCYLNMRVAGLLSAQACDLIGVDRLSPLYWEEKEGANSLYCKCIEALKLMQAKQAEDVVWDITVNDPSSRRDILRMFAMKGRLPEYRDNAPTVSAPVTVHLSFGNRQYLPETDTSKIIEEMNNEQST
jgi:hypothetical protein